MEALDANSNHTKRKKNAPDLLQEATGLIIQMIAELQWQP